MAGKATQNVRSRKVVDEGLKVLQYSCTGWLVHVKIEFRVW